MMSWIRHMRSALPSICKLFHMFYMLHGEFNVLTFLLSFTLTLTLPQVCSQFTRHVHIFHVSFPAFSLSEWYLKSLNSFCTRERREVFYCSALSTARSAACTLRSRFCSSEYARPALVMASLNWVKKKLSQ